MKYNNEVILSIIIPVYNTEQYLEYCVKSLIFDDINYEIIIVDDGSTDNSLKVANKWKEKYKFIKVITKKNGGQGSARNVGIRASIGKYLYFMDSDDLFETDNLYNLIDLLEDKELNAIFFDASTFFDEKYTGMSKFSPSYQRSKSYGYYKKGENLLVDQVCNKEYSVSPCLYIVRRNVIISNNHFFIEDRINEDDTFTTELLLMIGNVCHLNQICFYRRIRDGSTMTSSNAKKSLLGQFEAFKNFNRLYDNHQFINNKNKKIFKNLIINKIINIQGLREEIFENKIFMEMENIAKSHNYYNLKGVFLVRYLNLYKCFKKIKYINRRQ